MPCWVQRGAPPSSQSNAELRRKVVSGRRILVQFHIPTITVIADRGATEQDRRFLLGRVAYIAPSFPAESDATVPQHLLALLGDQYEVPPNRLARQIDDCIESSHKSKPFLSAAIACTVAPHFHRYRARRGCRLSTVESNALPPSRALHRWRPDQSSSARGLGCRMAVSRVISIPAYLDAPRPQHSVMIPVPCQHQYPICSPAVSPPSGIPCTQMKRATETLPAGPHRARRRRNGYTTWMASVIWMQGE